MGTAALIAAIIGLVGTFASIETNKRQNRKTLEAQRELQEDAQAENRQNMLIQPTIERQFHEFGLLNDPLLQKQGLKAAGLSDAAVAQALVGGASTGWNPQVTSNASPMASAPNQNLNSNMFQGVADAMNSYFQNTESQSRVRYNDAMVSQGQQQIALNARKLNLDEQQLQLAKDIFEMNKGLTQSEIELNYGKLMSVQTQVSEMLVHMDLMDAQKAAEYAQASLFNAQSEYYESQTTLTDEQVKYVQAQTKGQQIANLDADTVAQMKTFRLEISKALGCDVDAPATTQLLELMVQGKYPSIAKVLESVDLTTDGNILNFWGTRKRTKATKQAVQGKNKNRENVDAIYGDGRDNSSIPFTYQWNPIEYR